VTYLVGVMALVIGWLGYERYTLKNKHYRMILASEKIESEEERAEADELEAGFDRPEPQPPVAPEGKLTDSEIGDILNG